MGRKRKHFEAVVGRSANQLGYTNLTMKFNLVHTR